MMRTSIAGCLVLAAALTCHADQPPPLQFYKEVGGGGPQEEEILAVQLDGEIYATTRDDLADLRVLDTHGNEIPYQLTRETETRSEIARADCPSRVVSLTEHDNNSIEIVIALQDKAPSCDGLVFVTPLRDFERRVSVFGSDDGTDWHVLVSGSTIFDYSRYMDVNQRELALPKNAFRRFRIVVEEVTDQDESAFTELLRQSRGGQETERTERTTIQRRPLRIDRIELWHDVTQQRVKQETKTGYPVVQFRSAQDAAKKQTIITVRIRREPLTGLALRVKSANFSRAASVQVPVVTGVTTRWAEVGRGTVLLIRFRGFEREQLKLNFPEQRQAEYRIVIDNADSPALEVVGVEAEGNVYQARFFAAKGGAYRVHYGAESAEKPTYDSAALAAALGQGFQPVRRPLGPQLTSPDFAAGRGLALKTLVNNPLFLGIVIGLMVLVLALLVFRAGRRISGLPED